MSAQRFRSLFAVAVAGCLTGAVLEARHVSWRVPRGGGCAGVGVDPAAVTESYRPILEAQAAGRPEEALLSLQERTEKGPYPGYAWFLLGEAAFREQSYAAAVHGFRRAVEVDPSVTDRGAALRAPSVLRASLDSIQRSNWASTHPPELADLRYLQRRLLGGCE
ncbi:MAG: hypothetical protein HZB55_20790 [Deltaproteobacteria bacterium]|nr:hypothetical protein [Deltaproteobacteria bacterium]